MTAPLFSPIVAFPPERPVGAGARIPARSEKQAMDWSLALASQEIACIILPPIDGAQWSLAVDSEDAGRALRTLRIYHQENRGWNPTWVASESSLVFHWGALLWCLLLLVLFWAAEAPGSRLPQTGSMLSAELLRGEWWRPITATFLHAGPDHLAANLATGFVLIGLAMGRYRVGTTLLASLLAGIAGYLTAAALRPYDNPGIGASGVVMAALGMLSVSMVADARAQRLAPTALLRGVLGGIALFILLGTSPQSDVTAHTTGFVWGALLAAAGSFLPQRLRHNPRFDPACIALYFLLTAVAWTAALR